ncbi:erythromycin esterase family protein [Bowmanella dokdonensis]|uniref:Erythromycin esterase family protein n=1 Tax=Bowmanella dokdonensis TaxID=751969 RepID=A0A939DLT6_9ALTE|nr:erythromycin esterase family protein [Bowmanella dokdonensis]MBN7824637.1 erythromycin esterase family protein [Bowmanella dokdonensis]
MQPFVEDLAGQIRQAAWPLDGPGGNYHPLLDSLVDKQFILLGEASHGTHEFYQARIEISKRLILDRQINAIAIEGDWPSAARVNRFIRWQGHDSNANDALSDFRRFPLWMWRNTPMLGFIQWLREYNRGLPEKQQVGFYGLDMYSLYESVAAVLEYLDKVDPDAATLARERYGCLNHTGSERRYGYGVTLGQRPSCEDEVVQQLLNIRDRALCYAKPDDQRSQDEQFEAEQNARLVKSAEQYYRQMFNPRISTWNLRDSHMFETLQELHRYLSGRLSQPARIVIWAHNSHLGDARATEMGKRGEHNLGQLVRQSAGQRSHLIGLTTHQGTVTAASEWDGPGERKRVRPSLKGSIENLFHQTGLDCFYLPMTGPVAEVLGEPRLQRAIGVLYLPESERASHYFHCELPDQFDALLHFDQTQAIEPLDPESEWVSGEQDTYPSGL